MSSIVLDTCTLDADVHVKTSDALDHLTHLFRIRLTSITLVHSSNLTELLYSRNIFGFFG